MLLDLTNGFNALYYDTDTRVVILPGAGNIFSADYDLTMLPKT